MVLKRICFLCLWMVIGLASLQAQDKGLEYPNGIAAIVGNQIITTDEVDRQVIPALSHIQMESRSQEDFNNKVQQMRRDVLDRMINQILIVQEFHSRKGARIPQSFLDAYYHAYIQDNFQGDRSKFHDFLQAQGKSDREFKEFQKEQVIVSALIQELHKSQSEVSPERIYKFYSDNSQHFLRDEAILLHQITLLKKDEETPEGFLKRANEIVAELKNGAAFAQLAQQHSVDGRKQEGGKWGWINRTDVRKELADKLFELPKGEFGEPILFDNYAFIPYVEDKRESGLQSIDEARQYIEKILAQDLANEAQSKMIQRLRKKAYIRYFL